MMGRDKKLAGFQEAREVAMHVIHEDAEICKGQNGVC